MQLWDASEDEHKNVEACIMVSLNRTGLSWHRELSGEGANNSLPRHKIVSEIFADCVLYIRSMCVAKWALSATSASPRAQQVLKRNIELFQGKFKHVERSVDESGSNLVCSIMSCLGPTSRKPHLCTIAPEASCKASDFLPESTWRPPAFAQESLSLSP